MGRILKMKLNEIAKNSTDPYKTGVFVGVSLSQDTKDKLNELCKAYDIKNISSKYHITVMYSLDDGTDFIADTSDDIEFDPPYIATPKQFEIFKTQDKKNALVVKVDCEELTDRHNELKKKYGLTYTHEQYIPHVTLSYDCGDFDYSDINILEFIDELEIIGEYHSPIDPDWV